MKKVLALIAALLIPINVYATCEADLGVLFTPFQREKLCTYFLNTASLTGALTFSGTGPISAPTALAISVGAATTPNYQLDNVKLSMPSTGLLASSTAIALSAGAANTPNYTFNTSGLSFPAAGAQPIYPAGSVITPKTDLTPAAGARISAQKVGALATAAPTAVFLFVQPTAVVGKSFSVYNQGASPAQIIPEDGTINVTGALTPFPITAKKNC